MTQEEREDIIEAFQSAMKGSFVSNKSETINQMDDSPEDVNITDGLFAIARSLDKIGRGIERLGLADAFTSKGAIEVLAEEVKGVKEALESKN